MVEAEFEHRPGSPMPNTQLGQKVPQGDLGHQVVPVFSGEVYNWMIRLLPSQYSPSSSPRNLLGNAQVRAYEWAGPEGDLGEATLG